LASLYAGVTSDQAFWDCGSRQAGEQSHKAELLDRSVAACLFALCEGQDAYQSDVSLDGV
jgi:hypothetical protein